MFVAAHLLNIYVENYPTIPTSSVAGEFIQINAILFTLIFILNFLTKDWVKSITISLITILFEFYFSILHSFLKLQVGDIFITSYTFILPIGAGLFFLLVIHLMKKPRPRLLKASSYYSLAILLYSFSRLIASIYDSSSEGSKAEFTILRKNPSIVVVVLDEYAGNSSLKSRFHYDNSDFSKKMNALGFHEIQNPRSIYNSTIFSMASFFSMNVLPLSNYKVSDLNNRKSAIRTINNNTFLQFLKANNFTIHNRSIFPFNNDSPERDYFKLHIVGADLLTHYNTSTTIFRDLSYHLYIHNIGGFSMKRLYEKQRNSMNNFLEKTESEIHVSNETGNFFYVHFVMPHAPFLYKSNGEPQVESSINNEMNESFYLEYLKYCNKRIVDWLSKTTKDKNETIFIVMSDHGWKSMPEPSADKTEFNTILFVKGLKRELPQSMLVPNILSHVLDELYDSNRKKVSGEPVYLYD